MIRELIDLIRNGDWASFFMEMAAIALIVFVCFPVHECAHAWMAMKQGDQTARLKGRLTLNPMAHLDLIGSIMILLVGFGYAKPVPVNPNNLKNGKKSFALVALAGPVSNIIMAFIALILLNIWAVVYDHTQAINETLFAVLAVFFRYAATINIGLAIFNLIPIPPLDGSRILTLVLPEKYYFKIMEYERYIMIGVFALIFFGVLDWPLQKLTELVYQGLGFVAGLPFRWL